MSLDVIGLYLSDVCHFKKDLLERLEIVYADLVQLATVEFPKQLSVYYNDGMNEEQLHQLLRETCSLFVCSFLLAEVDALLQFDLIEPRWNLHWRLNQMATY